jgi:rhomboid family protein
VFRLLAANAVVLLLQQTIFTSAAITGYLEFDPSSAFSRPWTFVTYMFVHAGFLHLLFNSIALFVFGPVVEQRMGSRAFLAYYLYCGVGAAIFSLLLTGIMPVAPFIGASGAIMGVALAFARYAPDAELMVFPIPLPIKARVLVWLFVAFEIFGALAGSDNIAHLAHLGGLGAGALYFLLQGIGRSPVSHRVPMTQPRVAVPARGESTARREAAAAAQIKPAPTTAKPENDGSQEAAEIDRVLDKISALGFASLTAEERHFLETAAQRRRSNRD